MTVIKIKRFVEEYEKRSINWLETKNQIWQDYLLVSNSELLRRLAGVTQVITFPSDKATRTRLSHTLDVIWLVQTIAEELGLSVKVAMAIALAHDIGHLPFGHDGEKYCREYLGQDDFNHGMNAVRIARIFGIILHPYVAFGVARHSDGDIWINQEADITAESGWKLASKLVAICDDIACFSDLRDIIAETKDILAMKVMRTKAKKLMKKILRMMGANDDITDLEAAHREILKGYAGDIVRNSIGKKGIFMSKQFHDAFKEMKDFVYKEFHQCEYVMETRSVCISWLEAVMQKCEDLIKARDNSSLSMKLSSFLSTAQYEDTKPTLRQQVVDFITTCTDAQVKEFYQEITN